MLKLFLRFFLSGLFFAATSIAHELNENTPHKTPFDSVSSLIEIVRSADAYIAKNGTTIPVGQALISLQKEAAESGAVAIQEKDTPPSVDTKTDASSFAGIQRGPAIISADGIYGIAGEQETYAAFGSNAGLENEPVTPSLGAKDMGNSVGLYKQVQNIAVANGVPLPLAQVTKSTPQNDRDTQGSPKSIVSSKTTFGTSASQDATLSGLINSKKVERDARDQKEKEEEALANLKDKKKEEEAQEIKKAKLQEQLSTLKQIEPEYKLDHYYSMRDFFKDGEGSYGKLVDKDTAFEEKAFDIFKNFGELDRDDAKKAYEDFYTNKKSELENKFPELEKSRPSKRSTHGNN